jgi:hypothetical protein
MKNYKICSYVNIKGDTYYTVSQRLFWIFWETLKTYEFCESNSRCYYVDKKFDSYEDALSYINEQESRKYKRVKCELI